MGAQLGANSFDDLNLTPLIDIVLVVLIIMMVNMPIEIEEMGVRLPSNQPAPEQPTENPDQLVIAVYENGDLALNRRLMTEEVLFYEVTRRLRPMRNKNVFIDGFPTVEYGRIIDMMDLAREAGAAKVGLAKLKDSGP
ncbi:MAG: biopolymer transporter ExbD, partial [Proteobacteria bacterium]|nr:biopolymer transporter ExbD [Pseudomonadota bacterium]